MGFHGMQRGHSQKVGVSRDFLDEHHLTGDWRGGLLKLRLEGLKSGFKRCHIPLQR
jgi:hypothetical protein